MTGMDLMRMELRRVYDVAKARGLEPELIGEGPSAWVNAYCPCCQPATSSDISGRNAFTTMGNIVERVDGRRLRASPYGSGVWIRCLRGCDKEAVRSRLWRR